MTPHSSACAGRQADVAPLLTKLFMLHQAQFTASPVFLTELPELARIARRKEAVFAYDPIPTSKFYLSHL